MVTAYIIPVGFFFIISTISLAFPRTIFSPDLGDKVKLYEKIDFWITGVEVLDYIRAIKITARAIFSWGKQRF